MLKKLLIATAATTMLVGGTAHAADAAPRVRHFSNCAQLNHAYPHGVGRHGAVDHVSSGHRVTTFTRNNAVYNANTGRDRDKDHIACEKH